jgi:hypothetical protein
MLLSFDPAHRRGSAREKGPAVKGKHGRAWCAFVRTEAGSYSSV